MKEVEECHQHGRKTCRRRKEWTEKSHGQNQEGISWEIMWWDQGISKKRTLWFNVHEGEGTKFERISWDSKHWHKRQVLKIWEDYIAKLYNQPNRPENLEVESEEEVDADEKYPYVLQSEVEKAIKEMMCLGMYWNCWEKMTLD